MYQLLVEVYDPDLQENCFCSACIATFCEQTGIDATSPTEILANHADAWTQHLCRRIAGLGLRYAPLIRAAVPDCVIGAYLCWGIQVLLVPRSLLIQHLRTHFKQQ